MSSHRVSRNEPCPCGSGKKYKQCCYRKNFTFEEDSNGTIRRSMPISDGLASMLQDHVDSLGSDHDPNALLFEGINLEHAEFEMVRNMQKAGINPAIIYAFQETGMLISEANLDRISKKDLDLWQSKIEEFHHKNSAAPDSNKFPIGTTAMYGPNDTQTTKIVAGVILHPTADPIIERFVGSDVMTDTKVQAAILEFFGQFEVKSVVASGGNIGCPHEEGEDFPVGGNCPFCPYWKGKQGSGAIDF